MSEHGELSEGEDAALMAVMAHSMLNALAIMQTSVETIRLNRNILAEQVIDELLEQASRSGDLLGEMLRDIIRHGPDGLGDYLDEIFGQPGGDTPDS